MQRMPVTSSTIAEIGYDEASQTLEILFSSERVYQYFEVPSQVAQEFLNAASHGQFLNRQIKGLYRYARV